MKKYRIGFISMLVFTAAVVCVIAFAAKSDEKAADTSTDDSSAESILPAPETELNTKTGYGLNIDDHFIAASDNRYEIESVLNEILSFKVSSFGTANPAERSFSNKIVISKGRYPKESFVSSDSLGKLLGYTKNVSCSDIVTDYSGKNTDISLSVVTVERVTEDNIFLHDTKKTYTDSIRDGKVNVVKRGVDGETLDTYEIVRVDGKIIERVLIESKVISEKVDAVLEVGTKLNNKVTVSLGILNKPYDGVISSTFGMRWGRMHQGIDIIAHGRSCKGDPVLAAADGVVVEAKYWGGYGNCVLVDHGNGMKTLYAHLMNFTVTPGQTVKAGETIGHIGTTGDSTGYHLHFEVRIDDHPVDPMLFVKYDY